VNTAGTTTFGEAVGNTTPLTSLTTGTLGTTDINGGAVYAGTQTYNDPVVLSATTVLAQDNADAGATAVIFWQTVDSASAGTPENLTIYSQAGTVTVNGTINATRIAINGGNVDFNGNVGSTAGLGVLTLNGPASPFDIQQSIQTAGPQYYGSPVTLSGNVTLSSTGTGAAGNITFASTVNGADTLAVNTAGTTTFGGAVGVQSLTVDRSDTLGSIALNGGA